MRTDFGVFRERLAEACRLRNLIHDRLCSSIGLGGRRALDLYRVCQIADRLEVSVDWLVGRTDVMEVAVGKKRAVRGSAV